jgi:hypothetical protein
MKKIQKGKYRHYKGKFYEVLGTVIHSETLEEMVLYKALYKSKDFGVNTLWVRPAKMFLEIVKIEGKMIPRFKYVGK